jgi:hypothetical protein
MAIMANIHLTYPDYYGNPSRLKIAEGLAFAAFYEAVHKAGLYFHYEEYVKDYINPITNDVSSYEYRELHIKHKPPEDGVILLTDILHLGRAITEQQTGFWFDSEEDVNLVRLLYVWNPEFKCSVTIKSEESIYR